MKNGLTLLSSSVLMPNQLERHLEPLQRLETVGRILVARPGEFSRRLSKVEPRTFPDRSLPLNLLRMGLTLDRALRSEGVDWVLGFNPVPWGTVGLLMAARHRVPVSLSLIGSDYRALQRPLMAPFRAALARAALVTVTGARMRAGLVERGLDPSKLRILPHAIDTERFSPGGPEPDYDVVSVGRLVSLKRHDVLIDAVATLAQEGVHLRVAIVGTGPLEAALRRRAEQRKVAHLVEFLGFRNDVENVLRRARVFALVSKSEGMPFALIEAMSTGLVPVVTDVGTIADVVNDDVNGHLVPVGDVAALAGVLARLKSDADHRERLREAALGIRRTHSLQAGKDFWSEALQVPRARR